MSQTLKSSLIRLASEHPEFRADLLPLLKAAAKEVSKEDIVRKIKDGELDNWDVGNELPSILRKMVQSPPDKVEVADLTSDETDTDAVVDMTWHLTNVAGTRTAECSITLTFPFHWSTEDV